MSSNVRVLRCTPDDVFRGAWRTAGSTRAGWSAHPACATSTRRGRRPGSRLHHSFGAWPVLIDDVTVVEAYDPPRRMVVRAQGLADRRGARDDRCEAARSGCAGAHPGGGDRGAGPLRARRRCCDVLLHWRNTETLHRLAYLAEGMAESAEPTTADREIRGDRRGREVSAARGLVRGVPLDAVVVGAGPNGLAAAVTLARAGLRVRVYERADQPGGGSATRELTLPGFRHDVCSAVHPMAFESRFFREFGLQRRVRVRHAGALLRRIRSTVAARASRIATSRAPPTRSARDGTGLRAADAPARRARERRRRLHRLDAPARAAGPAAGHRVRACGRSSREASRWQRAIPRRRRSRDAHRRRGAHDPSAAQPRRRRRRARSSPPTRTRAGGPSRSAEASRSSTRWSTTSARTAAK